MNLIATIDDIPERFRALPYRIRVGDMMRRALHRYLLDRDGDFCDLCGGWLDLDDKLAMDHIQPVSQGGSDHVWNLRLTHRWCNNSRGPNG